MYFPNVLLSIVAVASVTTATLSERTYGEPISHEVREYAQAHGDMLAARDEYISKRDLFRRVSPPFPLCLLLEKNWFIDMISTISLVALPSAGARLSPTTAQRQFQGQTLGLRGGESVELVIRRLSLVPSATAKGRILIYVLRCY
jgi:hypothetical protein